MTVHNEHGCMLSFKKAKEVPWSIGIKKPGKLVILYISTRGGVVVILFSEDFRGRGCRSGTNLHSVTRHSTGLNFTAYSNNWSTVRSLGAADHFQLQPEVLSQVYIQEPEMCQSFFIADSYQTRNPDDWYSMSIEVILQRSSDPATV